MLDDGTHASITNDSKDFIKPPTRVNQRVWGIKGHAHATHMGVVRWQLEDDQGRNLSLIIKGTFLIPDAPTCILSPQHLVQQANDHDPTQEGTGAMTTSKNITYSGDNKTFAKLLHLIHASMLGSPQLHAASKPTTLTMPLWEESKPKN